MNMLINYFKIAMAVLRRRKFFTFISLFGISFTLAIVIVVAAFIDHTLSANYPDVHHDRELFASKMNLRSTKTHSNVNGGASFYFISHYVTTLKTPEAITFFSGNTSTNSYANNRKMVNMLKYTDDKFWSVLEFNFLEGKPYNKQQIDNGERVAVISADLRDAYFGEGNAAVGKYIETDNVQYRVAGVVKSVKYASSLFADIYVPYTLTKESLRNTDLVGGYNAILLLRSTDDVGKARDEYNLMVNKIPRNGEFDVIYTFADTYLESFTRSFPFGAKEDSGVGIFIAIIAGIFLLFLLRPTMNLVNINLSRIMDRSSEIGVRKAFGASSKTLVYQFVIENLILTFLGSAIGLLLSFIALQVINNSSLGQYVVLSINYRVLLVTIFASIVFGLLSGVYPAWRMSRMHVVSALKAQ